MISEEKIKVFISSKCDGELTNFSQVVNNDSKIFADKATRISYNLIRRALKVSLTEIGLFDVYVLEDDYPSTSSVGKDYIDELDKSHVCIFLIDNFDDQISEGLLTEINRAQRNHKKSFYLFLNHPGKKKTSIQESLIGVRGAHYYVINDIRDFIDKGYKSVINDIIRTYQRYCDGKIDFLEKEPTAIATADGNIDYIEQEPPSIKITAESFPTNASEIDKQIFNDLGLTKNKIVSLFYQPNEKDVPTSEVDKLSLAVLEVLLGEKEFSEIDLASFLKTLNAIQSPKLRNLVNQRWKAIANFFNGDIETALTLIESVYNENSEDTSIPKWLINDILIDWRNIKNVDVQIKNSAYDFSVQAKINQQDSLIFFPLVDRFNTNINDDIWDRNFKTITGSPYSTTIYNLENLFGYIANYLFVAVFYGSYTHIIFTLKEIEKTLFDIVQKENNLLHKIQLMRVGILGGDESRFSSIVSKYGVSLSHSTLKEIIGLYELADTKPSHYEKTIWKLILFRELGYYFSDVDYAIVSKEIFGFSREWISDDNANVITGGELFKALKSNVRRLPQEEIVIFTLEIFDKKYRRFYDSAFEILSEIDFSELSKELTRRLISHINVVLENEDKNRPYPHVKAFFIRIRKGQDNFNTEIDEIVEKFYPEFYKRDYSLEVFPEKRDTHIQRYIDSIKVRNKTQGKDGRFVFFADRPYYIVKKIIELDKPSLSEELLNNLLETILNTLCLETQTYTEKIDSIELLLTLKRQELAYSHNWDKYYSELKQRFPEIEKTASGFFMKDETLSLRLHLILVQIVFNADCMRELLEILALINSSGEYEIISSLVALKEFLRFEVKGLIGNPVMPILVQYISAFCFHESHDVRYWTTQALFPLIESPYADFVVNRLSKMMDDDDFNVRQAILYRASTIKNHSEQTYSYIIGKGRIDNNYLVRRVVEN